MKAKIEMTLMLTKDQAQRHIAQEINWKRVPQDIADRYKRGYLWASEVVRLYPCCAPRDIRGFAAEVDLM